jgi:hypothetical protein
MKSLNRRIFLTVALAGAMSVKAFAGDTSLASPALGILTTATPAELPAKAAALVAQADVKNLKQATMDVVRAAVGLNPAAAPAIVGSIGQASPAMAATAAATAVSLVPNQVLVIARAAAAAAPAQAGSVVEAICRVLPTAYQSVANAVAEVVPGAGKEILAGIVAAIPNLKNAVNQTLAGYAGNIPSVSTVLIQVAQVQNSVATTTPTPVTPVSLPRGPAVGPPLVPISSTPVVLDPSTGGTVPTGSRGYASP